MEETISRGLIFTTLSEKVSLPIAFFVSATVFALPHLLSILEAEAQFVVIGVVNLYLVSAVFTLLYLLRTNIYIVSGLHCIWNFVLNGVMGLSVSGSTGNENALLCFEVKGENILNGGVYGLEASIVTNAVLGISTVILMILYCKRGRKNGI
jgi:membrane protease YdiL (CAAX protease family)